MRHYQVRRRIDRKYNAIYFDIVEVYTEHGQAYTHHAVAPVGRTLRELVGCLNDMLKDIQKYPVIQEDMDAQVDEHPLSTPTKRKRQREEAQQQYEQQQAFDEEVRRRKEDGE